MQSNELGPHLVDECKCCHVHVPYGKMNKRRRNERGEEGEEAYIFERAIGQNLKEKYIYKIITYVDLKGNCCTGR